MTDPKIQIAMADTQLVRFLQTDLDFGQTLIQIAKTAKNSGHMDHYAQAKVDARKVADTVRHFLDRIRDAASKEEIRTGLAEYDQLISTL
jgi:hypothetical protein